ncbi:hypothetical protein RFI_19366 [Reticulomyxa filosa]|uniref:Uncharacterized protein n=1 Tax=Reticulomyxa filosa TaxID=46433 RepID=X6MVD0_RETFI|nr:hypothetical protein RFI_19366 [Reticulomyxa filosa]|eukprot:ETO17938.1 hypothetical protein RFI_19366 [Reticulomyxa filosa]
MDFAEVIAVFFEEKWNDERTDTSTTIPTKLADYGVCVFTSNCRSQNGQVINRNVSSWLVACYWFYYQCYEFFNDSGQKKWTWSVSNAAHPKEDNHTSSSFLIENAILSEHFTNDFVSFLKSKDLFSSDHYSGQKEKDVENMKEEEKEKKDEDDNDNEEMGQQQKSLGLDFQMTELRERLPEKVNKMSMELVKTWHVFANRAKLLTTILSLFDEMKHGAQLLDSDQLDDDPVEDVPVDDINHPIQRPRISVWRHSTCITSVESCFQSIVGARSFLLKSVAVSTLS